MGPPRCGGHAAILGLVDDTLPVAHVGERQLVTTLVDNPIPANDVAADMRDSFRLHDCVMRSSAATKGMPRSSHWIMPLTVRVEIMTPSSDWSAFRRISWMTSCRFSGLRWSSGRCQERGSAGGGGGGGGAGIGLIRVVGNRAIDRYIVNHVASRSPLLRRVDDAGHLIDCEATAVTALHVALAKVIRSGRSYHKVMLPRTRIWFHHSQIMAPLYCCCRMCWR